MPPSRSVRFAFQKPLNPACSSFSASLPNSEFKVEIESRLTAAYRPTKTFSEAFGEVLAYLFSNYGLILVDPQDEAAQAVGIAHI